MRRQFLTTFLTSKTPPKGAVAYLVGELARGPRQLSTALDQANPLAAGLFGTDTSHTRQSVAALAELASDPGAQVIALGVVLVAIEDSTGTHTWRNPSETTKRYFTFLSANGYVLSEVEGPVKLTV